MNDRQYKCKCRYSCGYKEYYNEKDGRWERASNNVLLNLRIERVTYKYPATKVYWSDGTTTVVKVYKEDFDYEKGLAMAVCKKAFGENYKSIFMKWAQK